MRLRTSSEGAKAMREYAKRWFTRLPPEEQIAFCHFVLFPCLVMTIGGLAYLVWR